MSPSPTFLELVKSRRTNYALSRAVPISDDELHTLLREAVKHTPTAFNSQSGRAVLVLGQKHLDLWDAVFDEYKQTLGGDSAREERNRAKFDKSFNAGYGTIVFFEDQQVVQDFSLKTPDFGKLFETWSHNSAGMLQYVVWTALQDNGIGANLQHYGQVNEQIEECIRKTLGVPDTWVSTGMMPFGVAAGPPGGQWPKTFKPIEDRVKVVQ